jgi:hypothetical protein
MMARKHELKDALAHGGVVRFTWNTCTPELILATGEVQPLDGRTYQAFMQFPRTGMVRTESGSIKRRTLVIEWRRMEAETCPACDGAKGRIRICLVCKGTGRQS